MFVGLLVGALITWLLCMWTGLDDYLSRRLLRMLYVLIGTLSGIVIWYFVERLVQWAADGYKWDSPKWDSPEPWRWPR